MGFVRNPSKSERGLWNGNISDLPILGHGSTAVVFAVDDKTVVKVPNGLPASRQAFERERDVYQIINAVNHQRQRQHVLQCLDPNLSRGLVLQRCIEPLRSRLWKLHGRGPYTRSLSKEAIMDKAAIWAMEASHGLQFVHSQGIIQADVGCHNMLLDKADSLCISDFSGSAIHTSNTKKSALVTYNVCSWLPRNDGPSQQTDLFALGSAIYEMATGQLPLEHLPDNQVSRRFNESKWPDTKDISRTHPRLALAIIDCWELKFSSVGEVASRISGESTLYSPGHLTRAPIHDLTHKSHLAPEEHGFGHRKKGHGPERYSSSTSSTKGRDNELPSKKKTKRSKTHLRNPRKSNNDYTLIHWLANVPPNPPVISQSCELKAGELAKMTPTKYEV